MCGALNGVRAERGPDRVRRTCFVHRTIGERGPVSVLNILKYTNWRFSNAHNFVKKEEKRS
jgi:hypothetical protein